MASLPVSSGFVCQRCILRVSRRPQNARIMASLARSQRSISTSARWSAQSALAWSSPVRPRYSDAQASPPDTGPSSKPTAQHPNKESIRTIRTRTRLSRTILPPSPPNEPNTSPSTTTTPPLTPQPRKPTTIPTLPFTLTPSPPSPPLATPKRKPPHARLSSHNLYWETLPPTPSEKSQANTFFTSSTATFLRSVAHFRFFPSSTVAEIAFVGRSNVGKSSLLNAICNADLRTPGTQGPRALAKTSKTRGFTRTMNIYGVGPAASGDGGVHVRVDRETGFDCIVGRRGVVIVDMPGYGEGSLAQWGHEIMKYLQGRRQLRLVVVLVDAKHGLKDKDRSLLASLRLAGVPHQVVLSKLDRVYVPVGAKVTRCGDGKVVKGKGKGKGEDMLSLKELELVMDGLRGEIQPPVGGGALGEILACSSEVMVDGKRLGIDAVRYAMLRAIGWEFKGERKNTDLVRTIKTNVTPGVRRVSVD